jgi:outer membrane receptor protein involved in Fe transport
MGRGHRFNIALFAFAAVCGTTVAESGDTTDVKKDVCSTRCDDSLIEVVIVTATRRELLVEQVPASVTAFSEMDLEKMGALSFEDYARSVPGLSFTDNGLGGQNYVIRGISTNIFSESRAATAVYLDETPITDDGFGQLSYMPSPLLVDIERVEVLRGPQGTLFGSGSLGGAARIITNQPNVNEAEGFAHASLATTKRGGPGYEFCGMANAPLHQGQGAVRGVFYYRNLDGWIDNTALGQRNVNSNETIGMRLAGQWSFSDRLTVNGKAVYQDRQSNGSGFDQGNPPWTQQRAVPEPNGDRWTLLNLDIHYRFDWGRFISTTSRLDRMTDQSLDGAAAYPGPAEFTTVTGVYRGEQKDFVQELRLQSSKDGRLDWLLGLYYQDQHYRLEHEVLVPGFDQLTGGLAAAFGTPDRLFVAQTDRPTDQAAVFGDVILRLNERWESTLGGRWFRFQYASDSSTKGPLAAAESNDHADSGETGFIPRLALSYFYSDEKMLYGSISGGYRPGGHNETVYDLWPECRPFLDLLGVPGVPPGFESDSAWNYELGFKSAWASRRVYVNATAYYMNWTDMQTLAGVPCGAQWVENAGEATSKGMEVEFIAYPTENLQLTLNGAWTDARLDENVFLLGGREGDRVPGVPEFAVGGALTWSIDAFAAMNGRLRVEYQYVGSSPNGWSLFQVPSDIPSYSLVNLRLGLGKDRWHATLFIENLFDERAIITLHDFLEHWVTTARPFTVGISARFTF